MKPRWQLSRQWPRLVLLAAVILSSRIAAGVEEPESNKVEEAAIPFPATPMQKNLRPLYVSVSTEHQFFVDLESIALGHDGVMRYTLVVQASGGATNLSYEGMRCQTRERRPYAFGRSDGTWSKARSNEWSRIIDGGANRHYAALFTDHFCPQGVTVESVDAARRSFRDAPAGGAGVVIGR